MGGAYRITRHHSLSTLHRFRIPCRTTAALRPLYGLVSEVSGPVVRWYDIGELGHRFNLPIKNYVLTQQGDQIASIDQYCWQESWLFVCYKPRNWIERCSNFGDLASKHCPCWTMHWQGLLVEQLPLQDQRKLIKLYKISYSHSW